MMMINGNDQTPVLAFLLDISVGAINSGLLSCALQAIRVSLIGLAEKNNHTRVGLAMVDVRTHLISIRGSRLEDVVVADYEESFGCIPADRWLVEVTEETLPMVGQMQFISSLSIIIIIIYNHHH